MGNSVMLIEGSAQNCSYLHEELTSAVSLASLTWFLGAVLSLTIPSRCLIKTVIRIASKTKPLKTWLLLDL